MALDQDSASKEFRNEVTIERPLPALALKQQTLDQTFMNKFDNETLLFLIWITMLLNIILSLCVLITNCLKMNVCKCHRMKEDRKLSESFESSQRSTPDELKITTKVTNESEVL